MIHNISKKRPAPMENVLVWAEVDGEHMWTPAWQLADHPNTWMMSGWIDGANELSIAHAQWWRAMPMSPEDEI